MFKHLVQSLFGIVGYRLVGKNYFAELERLRRDVEQLRQERDSCRAALHAANVQMHEAKAQAQGTQRAYEAACVELACTQMVLKKLHPEGIATVREDLLPKALAARQ